MAVSESWTRIVDWCRANAPTTFSAIRPPLSADERSSWFACVPADLPAELTLWYGMHDGVEATCIDAPLPGFRPIPAAEIIGTSRRYFDFYPLNRPDVAAGGRHEAGTVTNLFLPEFVPIGERTEGSTLFVDARLGPRHGCVTEWNRDDGDANGPTWDSIGSMLEAVGASLDTGEPCDGWIPVVRHGRLEWELEP